MSAVPRIVFTAGEPAGIGPDLALQLAEHYQDYELIVIADPVLLWQRAEQLGLVVDFELVDLDAPATTTPAGVLRYLTEHLVEPVVAGVLDSRNADYVLRTLLLAHRGCESGEFDAMVTGPVHKGVINDANIHFTGHTEFLAEQAGVDKVVMMLACDSLRVALATTHLPLREVSDAITSASLTQVIEIIENAMQSQFGITQPRIAVCGLNPHAGEDGHLGREEIEVINPVIAAFQEKGAAVSGSWPADTIFLKERLKEIDVVLAMYHDQGLPVLKHAGFSRAVNVTLGLPYIRTSVDHGTALDIAATGEANLGSLEAALDMARMMITSREMR
ncbi:MAG: 4-hydroxythreonine-4-phosphate dehydrogenase PdxA [Piscirickettsiaceae bacterium]|nr:4-hydroxythreonine-4-phosphate dehydrogenase PdxA [Piscirickettsiaceae bacterium]